MESKIKRIQKDIIKWYNEKWDKGLNKYPWRIGKKNPYQILIAEILLQHTTAKAVKENKSYQIFLEKYPTINELKNATLNELEEIFKPLGLYNQKSKRILSFINKLVIIFDGIIPNKKEDLLSLPGIGEYIANAILTFSYGQKEVPLDNNLKRIAFNVWNIKKKKDLIKFYKKLANSNPKKIYWALFDIGRFHCRKPIPNCDNCPLNQYCRNKI